METAEQVQTAARAEALAAAALNKELLRFTTAGSVDDGKSTLIGRLLYDARGVYEDQLAAVRKSKVNRAAGAIDFSLLTDGLKAEREQGITIDVAYRYFETAKRKFIIADTPGHEQYTRNMTTGASTADAAIILIDARYGVLPQSRRHAHIAALLGIPQVVVAVNKMDLAGYSEEVFARIRGDFAEHLAKIGLGEAEFIPISALEGDNVVSRSARTPWYEGESLLSYLENVPLARLRTSDALRFPVQYVLRPDLNFRGYAGQIVSGSVRQGDTVMALPSGRTSRIRSIPTFDGELQEAFAPMSVTLTLEDEIDVSRGEMLVDPRQLPHVSRAFEAKLVWMHEQPLELNHPYLLKHTTQQVNATITALRHRVDVNSLAEDVNAGMLALNEIGAVSIEANRPLFFDAYKTNRGTGSFILIDAVTNATVAAGMIEERRSSGREARGARTAFDELNLEATRLTAAERYARAGHYPATVWLTGRRELAYRIERRLFDRGCHAHALAEDVETSVLPELAQLLNAAGIVAILSVSGADGADGDRARALAGPDRFFSFQPWDLPPDDDIAAAHVCRTLEQAGIVPQAGGFTEGEGI